MNYGVLPKNAIQCPLPGTRALTMSPLRLPTNERCFDLIFSISAQAANPSAEQVLISTLMRTYNRNARPVFDRKKATNVTFGLEVVQLVNVVRQNFPN